MATGLLKTKTLARSAKPPAMPPPECFTLANSILAKIETRTSSGVRERWTRKFGTTGLELLVTHIAKYAKVSIFNDQTPKFYEIFGRQLSINIRHIVGASSTSSVGDPSRRNTGDELMVLELGDRKADPDSTYRRNNVPKWIMVKMTMTVITSKEWEDFMETKQRTSSPEVAIAAVPSYLVDALNGYCHLRETCIRNISAVATQAIMMSESVRSSSSSPSPSSSWGRPAVFPPVAKPHNAIVIPPAIAKQLQNYNLHTQQPQQQNRARQFPPVPPQEVRGIPGRAFLREGASEGDVGVMESSLGASALASMEEDPRVDMAMLLVEMYTGCRALLMREERNVPPSLERITAAFDLAVGMTCCSHDSLRMIRVGDVCPGHGIPALVPPHLAEKLPFCLPVVRAAERALGRGIGERLYSLARDDAYARVVSAAREVSAEVRRVVEECARLTFGSAASSVSASALRAPRRILERLHSNPDGYVSFSVTAATVAMSVEPRTAGRRGARSGPTLPSVTGSITKRPTKATKLHKGLSASLIASADGSSLADCGSDPYVIFHRSRAASKMTWQLATPELMPLGRIDALMDEGVVTVADAIAVRRHVPEDRRNEWMLMRFSGMRCTRAVRQSVERAFYLCPAILSLGKPLVLRDASRHDGVFMAVSFPVLRAMQSVLLAYVGDTWRHLKHRLMTSTLATRMMVCRPTLGAVSPAVSASSSPEHAASDAGSMEVPPAGGGERTPKEGQATQADRRRQQDETLLKHIGMHSALKMFLSWCTVNHGRKGSVIAEPDSPYFKTYAYIKAMVARWGDRQRINLEIDSCTRNFYACARIARITQEWQRVMRGRMFPRKLPTLPGDADAGRNPHFDYDYEKDYSEPEHPYYWGSIMQVVLADEPHQLVLGPGPLVKETDAGRAFFDAIPRFNRAFMKTYYPDPEDRDDGVDESDDPEPLDPEMDDDERTDWQFMEDMLMLHLDGLYFEDIGAGTDYLGSVRRRHAAVVRGFPYTPEGDKPEYGVHLLPSREMTLLDILLCFMQTDAPKKILANRVTAVKKRMRNERWSGEFYRRFPELADWFRNVPVKTSGHGCLVEPYVPIRMNKIPITTDPSVMRTLNLRRTKKGLAEVTLERKVAWPHLVRSHNIYAPAPAAQPVHHHHHHPPPVQGQPSPTGSAAPAPPVPHRTIEEIRAEECGGVGGRRAPLDPPPPPLPSCKKRKRKDNEGFVRSSADDEREAENARRETDPRSIALALQMYLFACSDLLTDREARLFLRGIRVSNRADETLACIHAFPLSRSEAPAAWKSSIGKYPDMVCPIAGEETGANAPTSSPSPPSRPSAIHNDPPPGSASTPVAEDGIRKHGQGGGGEEERMWRRYCEERMGYEIDADPEDADGDIGSELISDLFHSLEWTTLFVDPKRVSAIMHSTHDETQPGRMGHTSRMGRCAYCRGVDAMDIQFRPDQGSGWDPYKGPFRTGGTGGGGPGAHEGRGGTTGEEEDDDDDVDGRRVTYLFSLENMIQQHSVPARILKVFDRWGNYPGGFTAPVCYRSIDDGRVVPVYHDMGLFVPAEHQSAEIQKSRRVPPPAHRSASQREPDIDDVKDAVAGVLSDTMTVTGAPQCDFDAGLLFSVMSEQIATHVKRERQRRMIQEDRNAKADRIARENIVEELMSTLNTTGRFMDSGILHERLREVRGQMVSVSDPSLRPHGMVRSHQTMPEGIGV